MPRREGDADEQERRVRAIERELDRLSARQQVSEIGALVGAAAAVSVIPIIGAIIAATLLLIAAIVVLIGQLLQKALEDQAAKKERQRPTGTNDDP